MKSFVFFLVVMALFLAASTSMAADCPKTLGNEICKNSVEITEEEAKNIRAPGKAPEKKQDIKEFVAKRLLMSPSR